MIHRSALLFVAAAAVLFLSGSFGCTPKKASVLELDSPDGAWEAFRNGYCRPPDAPGMLVKASLYYSRVKPMKRTNRTLVSMWGNFGGPMRLDISAGIGKLLAHIQEDGDGLLVFYPAEKKAYAHVNPVLGATRLGMPFPFSLKALAGVAMGDFSGLVPRRYEKAVRTADGFTYEVRNGQVASVALDATGRPTLLEGVASKGHEARSWRLLLDGYAGEEGARALPERVTLIMDNGEKGVLRIKSRELKVSAWPDAATGLELPEDVPVRRLDNGYNNAENNEIPVVYEDAQ